MGLVLQLKFLLQQNMLNMFNMLLNKQHNENKDKPPVRACPVRHNVLYYVRLGYAAVIIHNMTGAARLSEEWRSLKQENLHNLEFFFP